MKAQPGGNWAALKAKITPTTNNTAAKKRKWKESQASLVAFASGAAAEEGGATAANGGEREGAETSFKRLVRSGWLTVIDELDVRGWDAAGRS